MSSAERALDSGSITQCRTELALLRDSLAAAPRFSLALAHSFTIEPQLDVLKLALAMLPAQPHIVPGGYGQIEEVLLDPSRSIVSTDTSATLVLWRFSDVAPDFVEHFVEWPTARRSAEIAAIRERIESLVTAYRRRSHAPLLLSTFPAQDVPLWDSRLRDGIGSAIAQLNAFILEVAAARDGLLLFDFADWAARIGESAFDRRMDLFARQPIAARAIGSLAKAIARTLRPLVLAPKKILALDMDGVLWGGVLGEDGANGIELGKEYPGNVYRGIQVLLRQLAASGVMLVVLSKNEQRDVIDVFENHPEMVLRLDDCVRVAANWEPKATNLLRLADELKIAPADWVFLDDQPFEREAMRAAVPDVSILENDGTALGILRALETALEFDRLHVTNEDRRRVHDYKNEVQRETSRAAFGHIGEFYESLQLEACVFSMTDATTARAGQLLAKTNQFNLSLRRHSESDLRAIDAEDGSCILTISVRDRFGDQGIVGLGIIRRESKDVAFLDNLVMSCRALGRGAEDVLLAELGTRAEEMGYRSLHAEYVRGARNEQVCAFLERSGLQAGVTSDTATSFHSELPISVCAPSWFHVRLNEPLPS
jgi:FkbH-like protein